MTVTKVRDTFTAQIYIAGDAVDARRICKEFCNEVGFCVTVTQTDYIYTGGTESGVIVGCINYPRFPASPFEIKSKACALAEKLRVGLYQMSYTVVMPTETIFKSVKEE